MFVPVLGLHVQKRGNGKRGDAVAAAVFRNAPVTREGYFFAAGAHGDGRGDVVVSLFRMVTRGVGSIPASVRVAIP